MIRVSSLKKNPKNPRQIKGEKLDLLKKSVGSFQKMMTLRPMIVDENNVVLGGNMRLAAIKALGLKEIPDEWVKRVDNLTEDEKAEFIIKDNNSFGEYDWDAISNEWTDYPLADWGLDVPGFEAVEEVGEADAEPQIDKAAELNKKWKVKTGDLWQIGEHRLLCGDSTNPHHIDKLMGGQIGQMIFTDPPYGVGYDGGAKKREKLENDHIGTDIYGEALPLLAGAVDGEASLYLWYADGHAAAAAAAAAGFQIVAQIIWAKNHAQFVSSAHYKGKHEPCYYAHKKNKSARWFGENNEVTLWEYNRSNANDYHPTQKPIEIAMRAINNSTALGMIVLDGFGGGGTTMVASQNTGRKGFLCEISENYCAVILERMQTAFPEIEIKRIEQATAAKT